MNFFYFLFLTSLSFSNNYFLNNKHNIIMRREIKENIKDIKLNKLSKNTITKINKDYDDNNNYLYLPKTENQKIYSNFLNLDNNYIITALGPAGTGKTLLACDTAIKQLKSNKIDKIIITRPVVPVEEEIGFLPGNLVKKMYPWTRPIFDIFLEYFSQNDINNMINNNVIEISPLGFMRGRTFKNSFIIADEMQNSSPNQMLMLLTRIGTNSKLVITGDLQQTDILINNGLKDFYNKLMDKGLPNNFHLIEMNDNDIQRSELVKDIIKLYKTDNKEIFYNNNNNLLKDNIIEKKHNINKITKKNINKNIDDKFSFPINMTNVPSNEDAAIIPYKHLINNNKTTK